MSSAKSKCHFQFSW